MTTPANLHIGDVVPAIELETATGSPVELGAFLEQTLVVVAIRYYG
jgi:peroxiredoxin